MGNRGGRRAQPYPVPPITTTYSPGPFYPPGGRRPGLALTTSCCFIAHSMCYFFHHFELPVIEAQLVHVLVDQNIITQTPLPKTERHRE
ncbi:unnamed protein product, partial [Rotaria sp. Silwood1]